MNAVAKIAAADGRSYITPEDVSEALSRGASPEQVRLDVLEILGKQTTFGAEDAGLCAYIAWRGIPSS